MPEVLEARAPAKINLTLRVFPRRADGYHDIESLSLLIPLHDELRVEYDPSGHLGLTCSDPMLPTDSTNLVMRAAHALREAMSPQSSSRPSLGARIHLTKRIPAGMGLGGGSSDAATTLALLNRLWQARLSEIELRRIGATLGSDVPLFFSGSLSVLSGRGEVVEALPLVARGEVMLVLPRLHIATKAVYQAFDEMAPPPDRTSARQLLAELGIHASGASGGNAPQLRCDALNPLLYNDLQAAAFRVEPRLARLHAGLAARFPAPLHMTGSGAGLFCLFGDRQNAEGGAQHVRSALREIQSVDRIDAPLVDAEVLVLTL
jgi:4-diphosphocytidyl-2-C-methyl-D-erythritol kinase